MSTESTFEERTILNKLLPVFLMIFNIYFFFRIIPEPIAEQFFVLFGIVGGVICLILSIWMVEALAPVLFDKIPIITGLLCISTLFIFGYYFVLKTSNFASSQIAQNGVFVEAEIHNKRRIFSLKGKAMHHMNVKFPTQNGDIEYAKILLSKYEYDNFEKGMEIPIYYSAKHPNIARIAYKKLKRPIEKSPVEMDEFDIDGFDLDLVPK